MAISLTGKATTFVWLATGRSKQRRWVCLGSQAVCGCKGPVSRNKHAGWDWLCSRQSERVQVPACDSHGRLQVPHLRHPLLPSASNHLPCSSRPQMGEARQLSTSGQSESQGYNQGEEAHLCDREADRLRDLVKSVWVWLGQAALWPCRVGSGRDVSTGQRRSSGV